MALNNRIIWDDDLHLPPKNIGTASGGGGATYTDADAVSAMGIKTNINALNHDRYDDTDAVSAMGIKADINALNHDRYTDAEAQVIAENAIDNSRISIIYLPTIINVANYDLLITDKVLHVTRTATGTCIIDLKTAQVVNGRVVIIKDSGGNSGTNNITITTENAETIDGDGSLTIDTDYSAVNLYCDGTNWFVF